MGASSTSIRVELLGAPRAWCGDLEIPLGPPKQRAVLGLLASRVNDVVSVGQIVDAVWGEDVPKTCVNGVHTYVAGLRRVLKPGAGRRGAGAVLVSAACGYSLRVDPGCIDAEVFPMWHENARRLRAAGDLAGAAAALKAALELWRGEAYAGVPGPFALVERTRLHQLRLTAIEEWATDMLSLGRPAEVLEVLTEAIGLEPLRERLSWLLMVGLDRCGRRANALQVYRRTRELLADELGIEPGEQLSQLHERIIANDPGLRPTAGGPDAIERREPRRPSHLPPATRGFAGRHAESPIRDQRRAAPRITVFTRARHPAEARIVASDRVATAGGRAQLAVGTTTPVGDREQSATRALPLPSPPRRHPARGMEPATPGGATRPGVFGLEWTPVTAGAGTRPLVVAGDDRELADVLVRVATECGSPAMVLPGAGDERDWTSRWQVLGHGGTSPIVVLAMTAERLPDAGTDTTAAASRICAAVTTAVRTLAAVRPDASVVVLTVGARGVLAGDRVVSTEHRCLTGLAPVLGLEFGRLFAGTADLPARHTARDLHALVGLLAGWPHDDVAAVRAGKVFAGRVATANTAQPAFAVCADATYVVTGGLGVAGRAVVIDMVRRGARNLLVVGWRREAELGPEANALLVGLRAAGLTVVYRDTAPDSAGAVAAVCAGLVGLPPVRGVVHAADAAACAVPC